MRPCKKQDNVQTAGCYRARTCYRLYVIPHIKNSGLTIIHSKGTHRRLDLNSASLPRAICTVYVQPVCVCFVTTLQRPEQKPDQVYPQRCLPFTQRSHQPVSLESNNTISHLLHLLTHRLTYCLIKYNQSIFYI